MAFDITPGSGKTISADVYGTAHNVSSGEQTQLVALASGTLGALALATPANPVAVTMPGGTTTASVASGAANTVVKASPGRCCRVLVTTAGSGAGNVLFYDNATTNSGTVIAMVPSTIAIGTFYVFDMPAAAGITVQNVASGPVLTVSYT